MTAINCRLQAVGCRQRGSPNWQSPSVAAEPR